MAAKKGHVEKRVNKAGLREVGTIMDIGPMERLGRLR
jgi:hypothetical protein